MVGGISTASRPIIRTVAPKAKPKAKSKTAPIFPTDAKDDMVARVNIPVFRVANPAIAAPVPKPVTAALESDTTHVSGTHAGLYELSQKLQGQVRALEAEATNIKEERDALRDENEVIGEHIYGLQKENGMLHELGMNSFLEKAVLAKQAEGHGSEISQIKLSLQQTSEKLRTLTAENAQFRSLVDAMKTERAQIRLQHDGLQATLESVKVDLVKRVESEHSLDQRKIALEREVASLKSAKDKLDFVVSGQHIELAKVDEVLAELSNEKGRSYELVQKLQTADLEIQRCYQEKSDLDKMISSLHVESAQLKTQRDTAMAEVPNLIGALKQQGTLVADLEARISKLQQDLHGLQRQNGKLDQACKGHLLALDKARYQFVQQEKTLTTLQAECTRLRDTLEMQNAGRAEMDARLHSFSTEKALMQSHMEQSMAEREQLQLKAQQAATENAAFRSRVVGMERMLQGYQDDIASLQDKVRRFQDEKDQLPHGRQANHPGRGVPCAHSSCLSGVAL